MKLFLLLLAIYSLIFYQSYKNERLKDPSSNVKEGSFDQELNEDYRDMESGNQFQNAVLIKNYHNTPDRSTDKKQPLLTQRTFD